MKALSLWQPWATAIAVGSKLVETRGWATKYRGPLLIHAAKRRNINELQHYHSCWNWQGAMTKAGWKWGTREVPDNYDLPLGALIAICDLVDCRPTDGFTQAELDTPRWQDGREGSLYTWTERQMGDFSLGRFGWVLENVRAIDPPIPCVGRQGLFEVDDPAVLDTLSELVRKAAA